MRMRLVAAKSHPSAARTIGIAPELQTALAFGVSGAFAAVAGVGLAAMTGYISPEPFSLTFAINIIAAAVLGGIGSIPRRDRRRRVPRDLAVDRRVDRHPAADPAGQHPDPRPAVPPAGRRPVARRVGAQAGAAPARAGRRAGDRARDRRSSRRGRRRGSNGNGAHAPATRRAPGAGKVSVEGLTVRFGGLTALERRLAGHPARRGARHHRAQRGRQDHADQHALRACRAARSAARSATRTATCSSAARRPGGGSASPAPSSTPSCSTSSR